MYISGFRNFPLLLFLLFIIPAGLQSQTGIKSSKKGVYVDRSGVLRWKSDKKEASFFGVNYTVPFAYGFRSHKALGADLKKSIDNDVYHFARLGLDAFRVHMWDVEISDSAGNLLNNEHLDHFDYLLYKLKQRNIKILLTPIAFWGNGYPQKDEATPGFATKFGKEQSVVSEEAIKAQENYIRQILMHVNPYTKNSYGEDEDIIAMEINNEPRHSGDMARATEYVNRLTVAAKKTGWNKPVFYNISESPAYARAIVLAKVDGHSFQWYPTGLVAGRTLKGNFLPHVDTYRIPFGDTIKEFSGRTRIVYEFDAGDIMASTMYPAMARSYRTAGFQWATQFAYDPLVTAYANTEYQTHYLNLAYTPSKAISLLIASKVFHKVPRFTSFGVYPADSLFDDFRVSYRQSLSEMNSHEEFYYSNNTSTKPVNATGLIKIAGVGSSPLVQYTGTGAYFLDRIKEGTWRLEIMPDVVSLRDPFEKASPGKEVSRIQWSEHQMQIELPGLGSDFYIQGLNDGNRHQGRAVNSSATIRPGTYLLSKGDLSQDTAGELSWKNSHVGLHEFMAPAPVSQEVSIAHQPLITLNSGKGFRISANVAGADSSDRIVIEFHNSHGEWKTLPMHSISPVIYEAEVQGYLVKPGILYYRIIHQRDTSFKVFPGSHKGDPYAWDNYMNETWTVFVENENNPLNIFNANSDYKEVIHYNPDWRLNKVSLITLDKPGKLAISSSLGMVADSSMMGWQFYFGEKLEGRKESLEKLMVLKVRAGSGGPAPVTLRIGLITRDAECFTATITLHEKMQEFSIPLDSLTPGKMLLLPRPYPGFQPLWFRGSSSATTIKISKAEKLEFIFSAAKNENGRAIPTVVNIESAELANQ